MITLTVEKVRVKTPAPFTAEELKRVAKDAALGVAVAVRKNFRKLAAACGSRFYWHEAAASTQVPEQVDEATAYVVVRQKGVRLHWKGGQVRPTGQASEVTGKPTRNILIPFEDSPLRKRRVTLAELHYPRENIHVITSRGGCPVLVASEHLKKKTKLIYLAKLVKVAKFKPRAEVMPDESAMFMAAADASRVTINRILRANRKK